MRGSIKDDPELKCVMGEKDNLQMACSLQCLQKSVKLFRNGGTNLQYDHTLLSFMHKI